VVFVKTDQLIDEAARREIEQAVITAFQGDQLPTATETGIMIAAALEPHVAALMAAARREGEERGAAKERERIAAAGFKLREAIALLRMAIAETAEADIDEALPLLADVYGALPKPTCDRCGQTPARRSEHWKLTLCDECADEAASYEQERWDEARRLGAS
jgi:hypothetical protein